MKTVKKKKRPVGKKVNVSKPARVPKRPIHYTASYIIDPPHPVTVNVIGCGGTGSQVLNSLARLHSALRALGHTGLFVRAIDPDRITDANLGRQLFSPVDVDQYKCMVLISRINRFFGTDWEGIPERYEAGTKVPPANITISCVDTGAARKAIRQIIRGSGPTGLEPYEVPYYWMDYGNTVDRGQVVIGTVRAINQPGASEFACRSTLPSVDKLHPDILKDRAGDDQGPSCSLAEALQKQDLFINTNLANTGLCILWKMFRELRIKYHGAYVNLETMSVNPIPIQ